MGTESFSQAFARNRSAWLKGDRGPTFMHNGKSYSVDTKEEAASNKAMRTSPNRGRGMGRAEVASAPTRSTATASMADRAAKEARSAREASEARAANARQAAPYDDSSRRKDTESNARAASRGESTSGVGPKITYRPKPDAPSIYASRRAGDEAELADGGRVGYANGGHVKARQTAKKHGKAC